MRRLQWGRGRRRLAARPLGADRGHCYLHIGLAAWVFECRVDDCGSGQLGSRREIITRGSLRGRMALVRACLG